MTRPRAGQTAAALFLISLLGLGAGCDRGGEVPAGDQGVRGSLSSAPPSAALTAGTSADRHYPGPCRGYGDGDGDGVLDGVVDSVIEYRYDKHRRVQSFTTQYLGEDGPGAHTAYIYEDGDDGPPLGERYDCDGAGERYEEETRYVVDGWGRRQLGVLQKARGHEQACSPRPDEDGGPDGGPSPDAGAPPPPVDWAAEFAAHGADPPPLGPAQSVAKWTWSDADLLVAEAWDNNSDGQLDEVLRFTYDPHGNLIWESHDDGMDGIVDVFIRYDYGCWLDRLQVVPGNPYPRDAQPPTRRYPGPCRWFWDLDSDGEDEAASEGVYDSQDRMVLVRTDWSKAGPNWQPNEPIPGPGQPKEHFRYTYDERGRRATEEWVSHGDDHPSELMTLRYGPDGLRAGGDVDTHGDGSVEGSVVYRHNERRQLVGEVWDVDGDGVTDQTVRHSYDPFGNRIASWYSATGPYNQEFVDYHFACWEQGGPVRIDAMPPPMPDFRPAEGPASGPGRKRASGPDARSAQPASEARRDQRGQPPAGGRHDDDEDPDAEPVIGDREEYEDGDDDPSPLPDLPRHLPDGPWSANRPDGSAHVEGAFLDGEPAGTWRVLYPNGVAQVEGRMGPAGAEGEWRWWYSGGQLKEVGSYEAGRPTGTWRMYYRDGQLFEEMTWADGGYDGPWRIHHRNGQLAEDRLWKAGKQVGDQTDYDEAGQKVAQGSYEDGRPVGTWRCWQGDEAREIPAPSRLMTPSDACAQ